MLNILQEIINIQPDEDIIALLLVEEVVIAHFLCACIATYRSFVLSFSLQSACGGIFLNTCRYVPCRPSHSTRPTCTCNMCDCIIHHYSSRSNSFARSIFLHLSFHAIHLFENVNLFIFLKKVQIAISLLERVDNSTNHFLQSMDSTACWRARSYVGF